MKDDELFEDPIFDDEGEIDEKVIERIKKWLDTHPRMEK